MKRIFTSIAIAATMTAAMAQTTNLWSGSQPIDWNTGTNVTIEAAKFADTDIADQIAIAVTDVADQSTYPQIRLSDGSWGDLPGGGSAAIPNGATTMSYYVTADMLAALQSSGLLIDGCGYTLTSVDIVAGNGGAGYENSVWIGNTVIDSWDVFQQISPSTFAKAQEGFLLRMKIDNLQAGAQGGICTTSWTDMPDAAGFTQLSSNYFEYTITSAMLAELQSGGVIVRGIGYTLTAIDLIDPAAIVPLELNVPVTGDDWVWNRDEMPTVQVKITNPTTNTTTADVRVEVRTDKLQSWVRYAQDVDVAANSTQTATFDLELGEPGFYQCTISVNDELARSFNIGYAPTEIISAPDAQGDFDPFWDDVLAQLKEVDPQYTLTELPEHSSADRKVYLVEMKSVADGTGNDITVRGYYAEPTAEGTYPALIHYQGYDSDGTSDPWCMNGGDNPGWIELTFSTRGQWINNRPPYVNAYGDWFAYGFGNKDDYYYRGAYADAVRAIDFIASRTKTDTRNIFAEGSSQGGALTIAAAALDDRLQAIAPAIQFMGDFPDYFQVGQWPASVAIAQQEALGLSDEEMYASLSYFDTKNLAPRITCPVITTIGMQDNVCPPHTNIAPYNNLEQVAAADKQISFNAELMHTVPADWWNTYMAFFDKYMDNTSGIDQAAIANKTAICHHMLQERTLRLSQMASPTSIAVTTIDGATVERVTTTSGEATIELPCGGAYVVTVQSATGEQSFKVLTK
ncbi:MAG TPA: acetylxylan esterase [Candidatus Avimuribaculum pullicola]|nr:acetylxylan esterase [Candidatus Avimuribaculum pullicola]